MTLLIAEFKKIFPKFSFYWLVLLFIFLKLFHLSIEAPASNTYIHENKNEYISIINRYHGKLTPAKAEQIEAENIEVLFAQENLRQLRADYNEGKIDETEFRLELPKLEKNVFSKELFLFFYSNYLVAKAEPEQRFLMYTDGWENLFSSRRIDWVSSLFVIIFSAMIFGKEFETDMRHLQISTIKGDNKLIFTKFFLILALVFGINLLSLGLDLIYFHLKYGLYDWNFPYQSLQIFQNSPLNLNLGSAVALNSVIRLLGLFALASLTMTISVASQSIFPALISGIAMLILPFALPLNDASKAFLPSPYSLISSTPFLFAKSVNTENTFAFVENLSQNHIYGIFILWIISIMVMLLIIKSRFGYSRFSKSKNIAFLSLCLVLLISTVACSPHQTNGKIEELTFNFYHDSQVNYLEPTIISLYPTFMTENLETGELNRVIRDPFINQEFIANNVSSFFLENDSLYYAINSLDYQQIRAIDLNSWNDRIVYTHYPPQNQEMIKSNLDFGTYRSGSGIFYFFVWQDRVFIYDEGEVYSVKTNGTNKRLHLKELTSPGAISFHNGKFYYINKLDELRVYSLSDESDLPLIESTSAYIVYIHKNMLYYQNLDRGGSLWSLNLENGVEKLVINQNLSVFDIDDNYVYYSNSLDSDYLYRSSLKTGKTELIMPISDHIFNLQVLEQKGLLYIRALADEDQSIITYRLSLEDLTWEELHDYAAFYQSLQSTIEN